MKWNCLSVLNISWNGIGDIGFDVLTMGITKEKNELTFLDVSFNRLTNISKIGETIIFLGDKLPFNKMK